MAVLVIKIKQNPDTATTAVGCSTYKDTIIIFYKKID